MRFSTLMRPAAVRSQLFVMPFRLRTTPDLDSQRTPQPRISKTSMSLCRVLRSVTASLKGFLLLDKLTTSAVGQKWDPASSLHELNSPKRWREVCVLYIRWTRSAGRIGTQSYFQVRHLPNKSALVPIGIGSSLPLGDRSFFFPPFPFAPFLPF